ncbi:MAG: rod shape-determining protein MreD [Acidiferrobacterales bacterium]|nr:rod shape-determining protein MreD [Acidiferrobacterales bacterium]
MQSNRTSSFKVFWAVALSALVALALMIVPLPQWLFYFWPDWIALVVVYWAMYTPDKVGPLVGFVIGVLLEVLFVRKFGVEGLGLATLAFLVNYANQQLSVLSIWQQTFVITMFIALFKLIIGWLYGLVGDFTITLEYWYSLLGCIFVWPFICILLHELRRKTRTR